MTRARVANGADAFAARYPLLFHVADAGAVDSIGRHGLLPAAALCDLFAVPAPARPALLEQNRPDYCAIAHPVHGQAFLRRQYAWDGAMQTRLRPGLTPTDWRAFLNRHAFLFVSHARAVRLLRHEKRPQRILAWRTADCLAAAVPLLACRWNNGMADRSPPERRRLRGPDDYVPAADWDLADAVVEVVAPAGIPPGVPQQVWDDPSPDPHPDLPRA